MAGKNSEIENAGKTTAPSSPTQSHQVTNRIKPKNTLKRKGSLSVIHRTAGNPPSKVGKKLASISKSAICDFE